MQNGVDFGAEHRGKYHDRESADAYMASRGWSTVDDIAGFYLPPISVKRAARGDILVFPGEAGRCLGICLGRFSMVMAAKGAIYLHSRFAAAAWGVS